MNVPTEKEYEDALKIVKAYEQEHTRTLQELAVEVNKDLTEFFKGTYIKKFHTQIENGQIIIYPTNPNFDEDYDGDLDEGLDAIGLKYGLYVGMDSDIYGK